MVEHREFAKLQAFFMNTKQGDVLSRFDIEYTFDCKLVRFSKWFAMGLAIAFVVWPLLLLFGRRMMLRWSDNSLVVE